MTYVVWDLETTIIESFKRKANPFDERNHIVCSGFLYIDGAKETYIDSHMHRDNGRTLPDRKFDDCTLMVGQNIRFDLAYIWREEDTKEFCRSVYPGSLNRVLLLSSKIFT